MDPGPSTTTARPTLPQLHQEDGHLDATLGYRGGMSQFDALSRCCRCVHYLAKTARGGAARIRAASSVTHVASARSRIAIGRLYEPVPVKLQTHQTLHPHALVDVGYERIITCLPGLFRRPMQDARPTVGSLVPSTTSTTSTSIPVDRWRNSIDSAQCWTAGTAARHGQPPANPRGPLYMGALLWVLTEGSPIAHAALVKLAQRGITLSPPPCHAANTPSITNPPYHADFLINSAWPAPPHSHTLLLVRSLWLCY